MKRRTLLTRQHLDCYRMILCYTIWRAWDGVPNSTVCLIQLTATSGREYEAKIFEIVDEASKEFESSRSLDRRSEYSYISQVQMILRVVGTASSSKGYRHEVMKFLTLPGNDFYRELVDQGAELAG